MNERYEKIALTDEDRGILSKKAMTTLPVGLALLAWSVYFMATNTGREDIHTSVILLITSLFVLFISYGFIEKLKSGHQFALSPLVRLAQKRGLERAQNRLSKTEKFYWYTAMAVVVVFMVYQLFTLLPVAVAGVISLVLVGMVYSLK